MKYFELSKKASLASSAWLDSYSRSFMNSNYFADSFPNNWIPGDFGLQEQTRVIANSLRIEVSLKGSNSYAMELSNMEDPCHRFSIP